MRDGRREKQKKRVLTRGVIIVTSQWKSYYTSFIGRNQCIVLIYQLIFADLLQALGFLISFHWSAQRAIIGPDPVCFAQGWLIQLGDVASGFFVLAIALHTFSQVTLSRSLQHRYFMAVVVGLWVFSLVLTSLAPILGGRYVFTRAGSWVRLILLAPFHPSFYYTSLLPFLLLTCIRHATGEDNLLTAVLFALLYLVLDFREARRLPARPALPLDFHCPVRLDPHLHVRLLLHLPRQAVAQPNGPRRQRPGSAEGRERHAPIRLRLHHPDAPLSVSSTPQGPLFFSLYMCI